MRIDHVSGQASRCPSHVGWMTLFHPPFANERGVHGGIPAPAAACASVAGQRVDRRGSAQRTPEDRRAERPSDQRAEPRAEPPAFGVPTPRARDGVRPAARRATWAPARAGGAAGAGVPAGPPVPTEPAVPTVPPGPPVPTGPAVPAVLPPAEVPAFLPGFPSFSSLQTGWLFPVLFVCFCGRVRARAHTFT